MKSRTDSADGVREEVLLFRSDFEFVDGENERGVLTCKLSGDIAS